MYVTTGKHFLLTKEWILQNYIYQKIIIRSFKGIYMPHFFCSVQVSDGVEQLQLDSSSCT
jgi:hypothetical protein